MFVFLLCWKRNMFCGYGQRRVLFPSVQVCVHLHCGGVDVFAYSLFKGLWRLVLTGLDRNTGQFLLLLLLQLLLPLCSDLSNTVRSILKHNSQEIHTKPTVEQCPDDPWIPFFFLKNSIETQELKSVLLSETLTQNPFYKHLMQLQ